MKSLSLRGASGFALIVLVAVICVPGATSSRKHKKPAESQTEQSQRGAQFDLFVLSLSWAPQFCEHATHGASTECAPGRKLGFVVHGFWPEFKNGKWPEFCGNSPVAAATVDRALAYMPDRSLIQHEWSRHGSCSGMSADDYFATIAKLRQSLKLPEQLMAATGEMSPDELAKQIAKANGAPDQGVRVQCREGELMAVNICYGKDLKPVPCPAAVRACGNGRVRVIRPK